MKRLFLFSIALGVLSVHAQLTNNKGNRLQTYPKVTTINSAIQGMVNQVDTVNLYNSIKWMQDLGCRDAQSQEAVQTQNWLVNQLETFGLDVSIHYFPCVFYFPWGPIVHENGLCTFSQCDGDTLEAGNVIAVQYGTEFPDEYIIISSHYDHQDGPGADDNASGTAGVVEIARILSQYSFKRSIMYISFNAEEYWLVGSTPFAEMCAQQDMNILGVFNLDMLGFFPDTIEQLAMYSGGPIIANKLWEYYSNVANLYISDIPTYKYSFIIAGDDKALNLQQYPAIYIGDIEYINSHPHYHKPSDTLGAGVNNLRLAQAFVRAALAATAELANGWLAPQNLAAIPSDSSIFISWQNAPQTSKYHLYRNEQFLIETTDTFYIDRNVVGNTQYSYFVKGIHETTAEESPQSNTDIGKISSPLILPYSTGFEEGISEWTMDSSWGISGKVYKGIFSLSNANGLGYTDNYFTSLELNWFSIPESTDNISLSFYANKENLINNSNSYMYIEATTDRIKWDKLAFFGDVPNNAWKLIEVSLNDYIGEPFVQIRLRIEFSLIRLFIDNFVIDDFSVPVKEHIMKKSLLSNIQIVPNPTTGIITIETGLESDCHIIIYDTKGLKIMEKESFQNKKQLDLSHLAKGIYLVKIITDNHTISKKIVVQ